MPAMVTPRRFQESPRAPSPCRPPREPSRTARASRRPWLADSEHFHHRLARIGFSQRRTVLYLYAWTLMLAGLAVALRFIPYSDHHGHYRLGWSVLMGALGLIAVRT